MTLYEMVQSILKNVLIQFRRGSSAQWSASARPLASGEPGYNTETGEHKVGNGVTLWDDLPRTLDEQELSEKYVQYTDSEDEIITGHRVRVIVDSFGDIDDIIFEEA